MANYLIQYLGFLGHVQIEEEMVGKGIQVTNSK